MFKLFILLTTTLTLLQADTSCTKDMKQMVNIYNKAQRAEVKKEYKKAVTLYKKSIISANLALQSCQGHEDYDYNVMYNFIIESENKIDTLFLK